MNEAKTEGAGSGLQAHGLPRPGGLRGSPRRTKVPLFGLDAVATILLASYAVHAQWIGPALVDAVRAGVDASHAISLFICTLIVGSVLGIDPRPLLKTFPRLVAVLVAASVVAAAGGTAVGVAVGLTAADAFFLGVVPIMGGGVNTGALPLAVGYGDAFGDPAGLVARLLPAVIFGNLAAMVLGGAVGFLGQWRERHGGSVAASAARLAEERREAPRPHAGVGRGSVAAALAMLLGLALLAQWAGPRTGTSEPVVLLVIAGLLLATGVLPEKLRRATVAVYRFAIAVLIYPVLVVVGLLYSPWDVLVAAFSAENLAVAVAVVAALAATGYVAALWTGLEPVEGSLLALSRAAMGGTGDIAILGAAGRLDLMPFAQVATRLGGSATILIALLAIGY